MHASLSLFYLSGLCTHLVTQVYNFPLDKNFSLKLLKGFLSISYLIRTGGKKTSHAAPLTINTLYKYAHYPTRVTFLG